MSSELLFHHVNNMVNFKVLGPQLFPFLPNRSAVSGFISYLVQPGPTIYPFNPTLAKAINFIIFLNSYSLNPFWINPTIGFSLIYLNVWRKKKSPDYQKLMSVIDISGDISLFVIINVEEMMELEKKSLFGN